jgi:hypothetical protein
MTNCNDDWKRFKAHYDITIKSQALNAPNKEEEKKRKDKKTRKEI